MGSKQEQEKTLKFSMDVKRMTTGKETMEAWMIFWGAVPTNQRMENYVRGKSHV